MLQSENFTALNDFVIKGGTRGRTSSFELKINGKPINGDLKFGLFYTERTALMSLPAYLTLIAIIALAEVLVYISLFKKKNYNLTKR